MKFFHRLIIITLCAWPGSWAAQCDFAPTAKVQKLLEQSNDTKKYDSEQRKAFLLKALDEDAACLPCLMRLGEMEFRHVKRTGAPFATARQYFEQLTEACEYYHTEQYYYLGAMAYADRDYAKAEEYFNKFLRFPDDDKSRIQKDYDKKYAEVEEALVSVKAFAQIYDPSIKFNPVKVQGVSTELDEYLPALSPDGEVIFYTRKSTRQAKGDAVAREVEEFTWSHRPDINALFDKGVALPPPFNLGDSYGGATISVDNRELIIAKKNPVKDNPQNVDLYMTRYELTDDPSTPQREYTWSELESLGPAINTDKGWEAQPSLSGDGQTLYFAAVRPECMKDGSGNFTHDIFYSQRQPDGSWGPAQNLGTPINTKGQEKAPYIHSDSHTLYFASDGHTGVGGMDLFYTRQDAQGKWSTPVNMGYPINTENDELGLVVSSDGEVAYFGARGFQNNRGFDIYQFDLPEKTRPEKVMVLKGEVKTEQGSPPADAVVELKYTQSRQTEKVKVNNDDGSYAAIVKMNTKEPVIMSVKGEGLAFNTRMVVNPTDERQPAVVKLEATVDGTGTNKPFVIHDIYYASNKADLLVQSKPILDEFALYLLENPGLQIEILGHTDNVGSDAANLALSMDRAFEVFNYLVSKGVDGKRITPRGMGKTKPIATNDTEEGRARNRRTEFVIKK